MKHREICDYIYSLHLISLKENRKNYEKVLVWLPLFQILV